MSDLDDDLFSDLEPIAVPKSPMPQARTVPSLADSLHELGLAQNELEPELEPGPEDAADLEAEPTSEQDAAPEVVPAVEDIDPFVVVEAEPLLHDEVQEELAVGPVVEPEPVPEAEPQFLPEPEAVVAEVAEEQPRVEPLSSQVQVPGTSRRWILISGGVAACAIAIGGWFLFGTTNKESPAEPHATVASAPTAEPMAMPEPASVAAPIAVEPEGVVEVEPVPTPATEPAPASQAKQKVAVAPKPATAKTPLAKPTPSAKPKSEPKAEPQWQDDALDALEDFEKRL